jgi:hypothetical protein
MKRTQRKRSSSPSSEKKDARILFALPSAMKAQIEAAAEAELLETSEWIRRVLSAAIADAPAQKLDSLKKAAEAATAEAERLKAAYAAARNNTESSP